MTVTSEASIIQTARVDLQTPCYVRARLDTLHALAYAAEITRKLVDDESADYAERRRAGIDSETMMREVRLGISELYQALSLRHV